MQDELPTPDVLRAKIIAESEARKNDKLGNTTNAIFIKKYEKGRKEKQNQKIENQYKKSDFKFKCHRCLAFTTSESLMTQNGAWTADARHTCVTAKLILNTSEEDKAKKCNLPMRQM